MSAARITGIPMRPSGAMVAVFSQSPAGVRYLLLRRADVAPSTDGDWVWGSPSGCVEPGEDIATCAARELFEETGIRGDPQPVVTEDIGWALFFLEVSWGTEVHLDPAEHNEFVWVSFDDACQMCRPEGVAEGFRTAVAAALDSIAVDAPPRSPAGSTARACRHL